MNVEDAIIQAVEKDGLNGLTIYPCEAGWQVSARFKGQNGWRVAIAKDPNAAVLDALRAPAVNDNSPEDIFG